MTTHPQMDHNISRRPISCLMHEKSLIVALKCNWCLSTYKVRVGLPTSENILDAVNENSHCHLCGSNEMLYLGEVYRAL